MSGASYSITVNDAAVLAGLAQLRSRTADLTPLMQEAAGLLADEIESSFAGERDPSTLTPWQRLADSTVEQRTKLGYWPGKILQRTGRLAGSFSGDFGPDFAVVGTNVEYAAIQFFGGQAGRNHAVTIPARQAMGLSPDGRDLFLDDIAAYLTPD